jgi:4-hydroxybenzoate polyprenyltransferase
MPALLRNVRVTLEMIKIEHTLFALPFAFLGAMLAANGLPTLRQAFWITIAMIGARSTAMAFNRIADRDYDAQNPRTQTRAIPAGLLSVSFVWLFTFVSAALFLLAAAMLNRLTLLLAPIALASVMLYSYSKRWTLLSHLFLGWCYACQDYEFDLHAGLHSIPKRFGIGRSLLIARLFHVGAFAAILALYWVTQLGVFALAGVIVTAALLVYQHRLVRADNLSKLNAAFFTTNAFVSVILFVTFGGAVLLRTLS